MTDWDKRLKSLIGEPSTDAADDAHRRARVGRSRDEMLRQGEAMATTLEREAANIEQLAATLAARRLRRVVFAGCGDSWFVGIATRLAWERLTGMRAEVAQAFDWAHYAANTADAETLVIGLSSSGTTPAVLAALDAAKEHGAATLGVSNTAGSPLATRYNNALLVHATRKGWPTQSSTSAIALLIALAAAIGRSAPMRADLASLPALMDRVTQEHDAAMRALADELAATSLILFAGGGPHYAAAAFGAAKIKELAPIHALAMPVEEYHHYRTQKRGDPLFLVAPDEASHERALDTALVGQAVGGRTIALVPEGETEITARAWRTLHLPAIRPELAPMLYSVPLHLFAYHFAEARFARGLGYQPALPAG